MKKEGSITIFLVLLLTCFFSAVFAILEAARVSGLKSNAEYSTAQAEDTVMASYQRELWENYHLMFWEVPDGDQPDFSSLALLQQEAIEKNKRETLLPQKNYYMLRVHLAEANVTAYQLATDDGGLAFRLQAAEMMKATVAEDALQTVLDWLEDSEEQEGEDDLEEKALDTLADLEQAKKESEKKEETSGSGGDGNASGGTKSGEDETEGTGNGEEENGLGEIGNGQGNTKTGVAASGAQTTVNVTENPLKWVRSVKKNGIYAYLMPEETLSQKSIDLSTCIGNRSLQSGNLTTDVSAGATDKLLFRLYLQKYFPNAAEDGTEHALDYELEYLIIGKAKDEANLKAVVRRILLMREATNLAFLETNAEKQEEAALIATALATAVGQPELEPLVQQGVLAAWAYAESLYDVKILLNDGKVALVKTEEQWHTDIFHLSSSFATAEDETQTKGLTYANYLQILLWSVSDAKLAQRGMDLMERNTGVQMDQMLACAEMSYTYTAEPLFWEFVTLGQNGIGAYSFQNTGRICFY